MKQFNQAIKPLAREDAVCRWLRDQPDRQGVTSTEGDIPIGIDKLNRGSAI